MVLNACADETRLQLLRLLSSKAEMCVSDLVSLIGTNQPKISRHLAYLRRAELVRDRKQGLNVYYRLSTTQECPARPVIDAILRWLSATEHSESPPIDSEPQEFQLSVELL